MVQDPTRPGQEEDLPKIQKRSKLMMTATGAIATALIAGLFSGVVTGPGTRPMVFKLCLLALIIAGIEGAAFLLIQWEAVLTPMRFLLFAQGLALFGVVICVAAGVGFFGWGGPAPADPTDMNPAVTASAQVDKHTDCNNNYFTYEPEKAIDDQDDTTWRAPGDGQGEWIRLDYTQPVKVSAIGIIPGHDKINNACGIDSFTSLRVVREVSIEFSNGTDETKKFDRNRSMQWLQLGSPRTTKWVRIEIRDTYPPRGDYATNETAISEIEIR
jgi:hypothetical protein